MSFVGQVAWDTEPVRFFFFGHFVFFSRARVGLVKKNDEKHSKKKHRA